MTEYSAVALDVGGVIYYDEPFELAWLQGTFDRLNAADPAISLPVFIEHTERFYLSAESDASAGTLLHSEAAAQSWAQVQHAWSELAQEIPGAVRAATAMARELPVVIVANQPPECAGVLAAWGLAEACAEVFLDSLVGVSKPDPALLGLALEHLGLDPGELLVVGNRVDHDVLPALSLGCPVAFVLADSGYRHPDGVHPDLARAYGALRAIRTAPLPAQERVATVASLAELDVPVGTARPTPRRDIGVGEP